MASNPADPSQKSEVVERETPNRVLTDHMYVNLILGEGGPGKSSKPGVITVDEAERKVPKEAHKAFRQGLKFKEDNDLIKALESFSQAIALYPDYVRALVERGDIYIAQRKLDQAAAEFQRATKINGRDGPALRGSGYCKLEKRNLPRRSNSSRNPFPPIRITPIRISFWVLRILSWIGASLPVRPYRRR